MHIAANQRADLIDFCVPKRSASSVLGRFRLAQLGRGGRQWHVSWATRRKNNRQGSSCELFPPVHFHKEYRKKKAHARPPFPPPAVLFSSNVHSHMING